jgi:hypothetical protein
MADGLNTIRGTAMQGRRPRGGRGVASEYPPRLGQGMPGVLVPVSEGLPASPLERVSTDLWPRLRRDRYTAVTQDQARHPTRGTCVTALGT